jgi:hypothetical protein
MKNKKSLLVLVILLIVAILGVGYAVVNSTELEINGTANVPNEDLKVNFVTGSEVVVTNPKISGTITDGKNATIQVNNLVYGEELTATYQIKNEEGNLSATLSAPEIVVSKSEYFNVTAEYAKTTLAAGETTTVKVTVKLNKTPIVEADSSTTIDIAIGATPAA